MAFKLSGNLTTHDVGIDGPHNTLMIQVDMSKINNAQALNGKMITITGFTERKQHDIQGREIWILVADEAKEAKAGLPNNEI